MRSPVEDNSFNHIIFQGPATGKVPNGSESTDTKAIEFKDAYGIQLLRKE